MENTSKSEGLVKGKKPLRLPVLHGFGKNTVFSSATYFALKKKDERD